MGKGKTTAFTFCHKNQTSRDFKPGCQGMVEHKMNAWLTANWDALKQEALGRREPLPTLGRMA